MSGILTVEDAVVMLLATVAGLANAEVRHSGQASAGGADTLTDAAADWAAGYWVGAAVAITGGTGNGQSRTVSANTATQLTVSSAWTTPPDATSTYQITAPNARGYTSTFLAADLFPLARVRIRTVDEKRLGWTNEISGAGKKWVRHAVEVHLDDFAADAPAYHRTFKALVDAVRAVFRVNQTLGIGYGILRFGEDQTVDVAEPAATERDGVVHFSAILTSECLEEIDG